jgi:dihydroorotase-like cyclic amidohydrolase
MLMLQHRATQQETQMTRKMREVTNKIYDAVAEGVLTWEQVAKGALQYMSELDVAEMAHNEEFFLYENELEEEDDEDEEDWSPDTADYCDVGSRHHY